MQLTQQWSVEMSIASQDSVKASLCDNKADRILNTLFFSSSYHKITKKTLEMYNPAKISRRRTTPKDLNIQFTVSVINIAMHYIYLQLISVLIYYTLKKKIRKQNIQYFSNFYIFW